MDRRFDPDFGTALEAAAAIRAKEISSVELTGHTLRRIDAFEPQLNAYVYQLREQALAAAARLRSSTRRPLQMPSRFAGYWMPAPFCWAPPMCRWN